MRHSETLAQAVGQPFIAENEANIEEVRVKKTGKSLIWDPESSCT